MESTKFFFGWEQHLLLWIHAHATPGLDRLFLFSRWLGNTYVLTAFVLAMAAAHGLRRERRAASVWLLTGLAALASVWGLKNLVGRERPHLWPWLISPKDPSFPSGHALGTSALFTLFALIETPRGSRLRPVALACVAALISYVDFGRLYLGVHWPTDVLAGWAIGTVLALAAARAEAR